MCARAYARNARALPLSILSVGALDSLQQAHGLSHEYAFARAQLDALHYQQPPYSTQYPTLPGIFDNRPCLPVNSVIMHNYHCGGEFQDFDDAQAVLWNITLVDNDHQC